jgi:hypothetical protein
VPVAAAVMSTGSTRVSRPTRTSWVTRTTRPVRITRPTRVTRPGRTTGPTRVTRPVRTTGPTRVTRPTRPWSTRTTGASRSAGSRSKSSVAATTKATASVAATAKPTAATKAAAATTTATAAATTAQRDWYRVMKRGRSALAARTGQRARNGACRSCSCSHSDCRECSGDGGSGHQLLRSHHRDFCLLRAYAAPDWTKSTVHRLPMNWLRVTCQAGS